MIKEFTDLKAWSESHKLVIHIYQITKAFPKDELFGLVSQLKRASVSITSNIAEGFSRNSNKDKLRFYYMSSGSISEIRNQVILSKDLGIISDKDFRELIFQINNSHKLLKGLIRSTASKLV